MKIKQIPDNPKYAVTSTGDVYNLVSGLKLKQNKNIHGYYQVSFRQDGEHKPRSVHRLVAESFVEGNHTLLVNHKDGVKTNNNADNLEFVTRKENQEHAIKNGLAPYGERIFASKLTLEIVKEIIERKNKSNWSQRKLAKMYGVNQGTIHNILAGKSWVKALSE